MVNYAQTQLYELIEHDESGQPVVYRGQTTQPLHRRLAQHRKLFKLWKEGKHRYLSSFEVLKHGCGRIELVRVVNCANKREANREEGKFIREPPRCVNI
jgi:predicted GIY-YIG superfamily endonuclease